MIKKIYNIFIISIYIFLIILAFPFFALWLFTYSKLKKCVAVRELQKELKSAEVPPELRKEIIHTYKNSMNVIKFSDILRKTIQKNKLNTSGSTKFNNY